MNRTAFTLLLCFSLGCMAQEAPQQLMRKALEAQQAGQFAEAVQNYRTLLKQYPNIFELRSNLGASLAGEGRYAEAIAEYQKALALRSNPAVRLNLALAYYKSGELLKAADTLKQVHAEDPANLQAIELLADCYLQLGQNKNVISFLTPIRNQYPDNDAITYLLGTALVRDGQLAEGEKIIDRILRNGDSAQARLLMGTAKYMAADYPGARADLEKAIQMDPKLPDVYAYYGKTLFDSGDHIGSQAAFEKELQLDPNNFDANLDMGLLLRGSMKNSEALPYFRHALEVHPGDPAVRFEIATCEMSLGQLPEASKDLESLVKDRPDFQEAVWQLATVYTRMGRKADAERERAAYMKLKATAQAKAAEPSQEGPAGR
jgi:tetratricopeptide (TPR) repeat protein